MSKDFFSSTTRGVTLTSARICTLMSCCQAARPLPLGFDAENNPTAQVVPANSLTKEPVQLAPNVSDCVEVLLQPRFSDEEDTCHQGHGPVPRNATLLCRTTRGVTLTSARICTLLTVLLSRAQPSPKEQQSACRKSSQRCLNPRSRASA